MQRGKIVRDLGEKQLLSSNNIYSTMSSPKWEIVGFQNAAISEKIITAAAKLFSDNYGLWGPLAAAKLKRSITQGAWYINPAKADNAHGISQVPG